MPRPFGEPDRRWLQWAALAAIGFYAGTAHLTRGHEADFGKQWLAARLVATGQAASLFDLDVQRSELERHFHRDVIDRGIWREGIGGPTYPPTFAVVLAPLGWLSPRWAQWCIVQLSLVAVLFSARLLNRLTHGQVHSDLVTLATLSMPSFFLAMGVGQNSALSMLVLVGGLWLISNGEDVRGGAVWGLFALKPTWGFAIFWLPAALGRPRAYLGLATSAIGLSILTLPICGLESWSNWWVIAQQTERYYQSLPRWTALSRDVPGLLRRVESGEAVEVAGWATVFLIMGISAWVWTQYRPKGGISIAGPQRVALVTGVLLSCPRFMFYDMTLAVVPIILAFAEWPTLNRRGRAILAALVATLWLGTAFQYVQWSMLGPPIDTLALGILWLWSVARSWSVPAHRSVLPDGPRYAQLPQAEIP